MKARQLAEREGTPDAYLRLRVVAGGCSGFEYVFGWEREPRAADVVVEGPDGAQVFIDPKSLPFVDGTELDYDTALLSKGFVLNNPNAKSTCGCGSSFSV